MFFLLLISFFQICFYIFSQTCAFFLETEECDTGRRAEQREKRKEYQRLSRGAGAVSGTLQYEKSRCAQKNGQHVSVPDAGYLSAESRFTGFFLRVREIFRDPPKEEICGRNCGINSEKRKRKRREKLCSGFQLLCPEEERRRGHCGQQDGGGGFFIYSAAVNCNRTFCGRKDAEPYRHGCGQCGERDPEDT